MTAEDTITLLELLLQNPEGVSPQDCLARLDVSRSTLFNLLRELKTLGYLEQSRQRGRYLAGPRLLAWQTSSSVGPQELLTAFYQEAAHPPLDETLALAVPNQSGPATGALILAQVEGKQHIRGVYEVGQPAGDCAAADIFAPAPPDSVQSQGYHLRITPEALELALPICPDGYRPAATLLVSASGARHTPESLLQHLPALREMAARLSHRLGALVYAPYQQPDQPRVGPTIALNTAEIADFLHGPWAARLACVRPDGSPHVVPVWQEWNGQTFYITAWQGSRWVDYVRANPRVSLTIDEPWPPLRRVSAQGAALPIAAIPGGLPALLDRLSRRYLGQPHQSNRSLSVFQVTPEALKGWRGLHEA
jgi:DNA-binding IclR family transcriptional regulator